MTVLRRALLKGVTVFATVSALFSTKKVQAIEPSPMQPMLKNDIFTKPLTYYTITFDDLPNAPMFLDSADGMFASSGDCVITAIVSRLPREETLNFQLLVGKLYDPFCRSVAATSRFSMEKEERRLQTTFVYDAYNAPKFTLKCGKFALFPKCRFRKITWTETEIHLEIDTKPFELRTVENVTKSLTNPSSILYS